MATRKSTAKSTATKSPEKAVSQAKAQVDKAVEKETEQGFRGVEVDPTPNEHYTVPGVIRNKPVPETDAEARAAAQRNNR